MSTQRLLSLWVIVLLLPGCERPGASTAPPRVTVVDSGRITADPAPRRMLALGDSYTIGEKVEPAERWPVKLVAALRARGEAFDDPTIVAKTGWTTDELSAGIDKAQLAKPYDLVTLLIGVNNQFRGRDVEEYRKQFVALLGRAVDFAGGTAGRVIVVSIPDWGVTPFAARRDRAAIATAIDRFNAVNREEALRAGARYVEITVASRRAKDEPALVASDGLHPSAKMYVEWAEAVLPVATAALAGAPRVDK